METSEGLLRGALETLPVEVAILDADGVIVYTNEAWKEFGRANGLGGEVPGVGVDYLAATEAADGDEYARRAAAGVRGVLEGEAEHFTMEYPCHGPEEQRWFLMYAKRYTHAGDRYAQLAHLDITERKLAELDVREKNERLEAVAGVLSHDIRSPLNVALGFLDRIRDRRGAEAAELDRVRSALERIDTIVSDALLLVGKAEVESVEPVSLRERAHRAWAHVDTPNATLAVDGDLRFEADASVLETLLENLFRNAAEHGAAGDGAPTEDSAGHDAPDRQAVPGGGAAGGGSETGPGDERTENDGGRGAGGNDGVTVRVGALPGGEGFYVADDGPGIPEAERERVFEARVSAGTGERHSGLGLFIAEKVCAAHGWAIAATESESGGARFEVTGVTAVPADGA